MSAAEEAVRRHLGMTGEGPLVALALDPGGTTGYAIAVQRDNQLDMFVEQEQMSLLRMDDLLTGMIHSVSNLHIIYETFEFRQFSRTGLDLTPVKLIGVIELLREQYEPFVQFYNQTAATGKSFWTDEKLKNIGAYSTRKHGRDATRHLLQWAQFGAGGQWIDLEKTQINMLDKWPEL